jgi:molybdopterin biosynthesis enzyme
MLPRGADAVVMVEQTDLVEDAGETWLEITKPVSPGENVTFAGTDIAKGETVLRAGQPLSSREIGVLVESVELSFRGLLPWFVVRRVAKRPTSRRS